MSQEEQAPTSNDATPETPAPETPMRSLEELERLDAGLKQLRAVYQDLAKNLSSEKVFDALMAGLSSHPGFIAMVRQLVIESNAEFISQHQQGEGHAIAVTDEPGVKGYIVTNMSREPLESTGLRISRNDPEHPTAPNGFEAFIFHEDQWVQTNLTALMHAAVEQAFANNELLLSNVYYWTEMAVLTTEPLDETSVAVSASENADGQAV